MHGHCHHKSLFGMDDEKAFLQRLGLDFQLLDSGCCGMAGSFGFERGDKYEVSMRVGEQRLLPAVRRCDEEVLVIANGFSCREQIEQGTTRQAMHVAEAARLALTAGDLPAGDPERAIVRSPSDYPILEPARPAAAAALSVGALAFGLALRGRGRTQGWRRLLTSLGSLALLGTTAVAAIGLTALSASERNRRRKRSNHRPR